MGFDSIKKKSADMGKKSMSAFMKINKYENPQTVLNLIAHICTGGQDVSVKNEFSPYYDAYHKMAEEYAENAEYRNDFIVGSMNDLVDNCYHPFAMMPVYLDHTGFSDAPLIAVGGGYSSGKSSFLNSITGMGAVLPTGIEPVSMINTYISFSDKTDKLIISGQNLKRHIVKLDREVLDCIQHSSKSKVYVSAVLDELYIKIPVSKSHEHMKGLVFIDTPGYNNSDNANKENGKKDIDTALEALKESDALFWCIDTEAGTVSQRDIEILNELIDYNEGDFPYVIVFNKMDKKPEAAVAKILKDAEKVCRAKLKQMPLDILGYSSIGESAIVSLMTKKKASVNSGVGKVLASLFSKMNAKQLSNHRTVSYWIRQLSTYFEDEMTASDEALASLEEERKELAKKKAEAFSETSNSESGIGVIGKDTLDMIEDIMLDNYGEILEQRDQYADLLQRAMKGWERSSDRESEWADKVGFFSDASKLQRQAQNAIKEYNRVMEAWNNMEGVLYWKKEDREYAYKVVINELKDGEAFLKISEEDDYETLKEEYDNIVLCKRLVAEYKSFLKKKQPEIVSIFSACCQKAIKNNEKRLRSLQNIKKESETDIFSAIANDNMDRFLDCFSNGVDLTKCNNQGFSPLTYIAKNSNNTMMKFLITHEADLSLRDQNGYNALETAAIYHCQDICELLLQADRGLVSESKPLDELADNDRFKKWISNI